MQNIFRQLQQPLLLHTHIVIPLWGHPLQLAIGRKEPLMILLLMVKKVINKIKQFICP